MVVPPNGKQYRITLGNYFVRGKATCHWDSCRLPVLSRQVFSAVEIFLSCTRQSIRRTGVPQVARSTLKPVGKHIERHLGYALFVGVFPSISSDADAFVGCCGVDDPAGVFCSGKGT